MKCLNCSEEFSPKCHNAKYCSNSCKSVIAARKYYAKNRENELQKKKQFYKDNKEIIIKKTAKYCDDRRKVDINFRLKRSLRSRLYNALRGNYKSGSAVRDLGCSIQELKVYLESKFQQDMSWSNYGKWHIDHVVALNNFDLTVPEELKKACHYTNLQPLWASDNIRKSDGQ